MRDFATKAESLLMQIDLLILIGSALAAIAIGALIMLIEWQQEIKKYNKKNY